MDPQETNQKTTTKSFWSPAWIFLTLVGLPVVMVLMLKFAAGTLRI